MRNLTILVVLLLGFFNSTAQEVIITSEKLSGKIEKGSYYKYSEEDVQKIFGTWISDDHTFRLYITEKTVYFEDFDVSMQKFVGKYCNESLDCNFDNKEFSLKAGSIEYKDGITVSFLFNDEKKNKLGTAKLKLIEGNKAKWTLTNSREGLIIGEYDRSFSVPTEIILTKVE